MCSLTTEIVNHTGRNGRVGRHLDDASRYGSVDQNSAITTFDRFLDGRSKPISLVRTHLLEGLVEGPLVENVPRHGSAEGLVGTPAQRVTTD
jgi:hypothetical protein